MKYAQPYDFNEELDIEEERYTRRHSDEPESFHWCLGAYSSDPCSVHGHLVPKADLYERPTKPAQPQETPTWCPECMKAPARCICGLL